MRRWKQWKAYCGSCKNVTSLIGEISLASSEQSAGLKELGRAVEQLRINNT